MNAGATIITSNLRDFKGGRESLRLQVMTPVSGGECDDYEAGVGLFCKAGVEGSEVSGGAA